MAASATVGGVETYTVRVYPDGTITLNWQNEAGDFVATRADGNGALIGALDRAREVFDAHDTDGS